MQDGPSAYQFGDFKTLPIYAARGRLLQDLHPFGKAQFVEEIGEIDYAPFSYAVDAKWLATVSNDYKLAVKMVRDWQTHLSNIQYFIQFRDDVDQLKTISFHSHTKLVSAICDARLGIDTSVLWTVFHGYVHIKSIHSDYREDTDRSNKYDAYSERLKEAWRGHSDSDRQALQLIQRIVLQIELKADSWSHMPVLQMPGTPVINTPKTDAIRLFYCYSHKDEGLREQLQSHLSLLKRQRIIEGWHDRRIGAGREWAGQIDENLKLANIILLLVSADFIASDYCYDVEMTWAMKQHDHGSARVVPIILRACDWVQAPFGKLKRFPRMRSQ